MKKIFFLLIGFLVFLKLDAQDLRLKLDGYLEKELSNFNIPDLEILVVNKDSILYSKSIGKSTTPDRPYYIGSVSKSLTAFGILRLIEQGKIEFDQAVADILPGIIFSNNQNEITVRQLLTHTSGISKAAGFKHLPTLNSINKGKTLIENDQLIPLKHEYSNLNYALLGLMIEKVSESSFAEYMDKEVFTPLEMDNSIIGSRRKIKSEMIDQYQYFGPFPMQSNQLNYSQSSIPAGFIASSAKDLGNYLNVNLSQGLFKGNRIVDAALLKNMHTTWNEAEYGYAMGWKQGKYNGNKFFQHLGSTATSYSGVFFIPEKESGFVLLTNSNSLDFSEELAEGILDILCDGEPNAISSFEFYLRTGVLLALLLVVLNFVYKFIQILRGKLPAKSKMGLLNILIQLALLLALIFAFPQIAEIPFFSFLRIQPDIGIFLLFSLLLPLILAILKIIRK